MGLIRSSEDAGLPLQRLMSQARLNSVAQVSTCVPAAKAKATGGLLGSQPTQHNLLTLYSRSATNNMLLFSIYLL
jgi:hypothetical protein